MKQNLVLLALLVSACAARGGAGAHVEASGGTKEAARSPAEPPAPPLPQNAAVAEAPAVTDPPGSSPYAGTIDRKGLVAIIDQGLGRFFSHLRLSPVMQGKRFAGFAVASVEPKWGDIGLLPGDVIVRVNGQPIERPEQAMAAFESLRVASEVAVELTRAGVPSTLRFRIE